MIGIILWLFNSIDPLRPDKKSQGHSPLGTKEIDGLLVPPGIASMLLTDHLDPVVQSIVSLTISLRHKFVTQISAKVTIHCYFLLKKCENPLQCKGFSHFFNKK